MLPALALVVAAVLAEPAAAPGLAPQPDWAVDEAPEDDDGTHDQLLSGVRLPGLIDTSGLDVGLETYGLYGAQGDIAVDADLTLLGEITHPFEGEVSELQVSLGIFEAGQATRAANRLTLPPLQLSQADLDTPLPRPLATTDALSIAEHIDTGSRAEVERSEDLGEVTVSADDLPEYILLTRSYQIAMPTVGDVELILDRGGTADHAALASWAEEHRDTEVPFDDDERARVMTRVRERFRRLRAPPALGDYQRLRSMVGLIRTMASAEDVESLLRLERPMNILHTSAILSYDLALSDESTLGLGVHGMEMVPSRSEFLASAESAYRSLRPMALGKLLRIAFDPVDFRDAPSALNKHRLHRQATAMLEPLRTTDVNGALGAVEGRPTVQREVLRFYIEARHAPSAEPLVDWLSEYPEAVDDLGRLAVTSIPDAVLPAALQRYVDPGDPEHRAAMRELLEMMPADRAVVIVDALRSLGVPLSEEGVEGPGALGRALEAFERFERDMASERSAQLVQRLSEVEPDPSSLRAALRDAGRLAQISPAAIEANADRLLELHATAALELDEEAPLERMRALRQLLEFPWGRREGDAKRAHAVTEARIFISKNEPQKALSRLLEFDDSLAHPQVRELFAGTLFEIYEGQVLMGQYQAAEHTLDRAAEHVPDELPLEQLRGELSLKRYRPGYFLGGAFGLALLSALAWLTIRGSGRALARWRVAHKELHRLMRRQEDAEASADEAAMFDGEESGVRFTVARDPSSGLDLDQEPSTSSVAAKSGADDPQVTDCGPPDRQPDVEADAALAGSSGSLGASDDPLDDPLADPFDWDSPFEDDVFGDGSPRAAGGSDG